MPNEIYLDYSATTPTDLSVLKKMEPYFSAKFGNPSSVHSFGQRAMARVDKSRQQIANFLKCQLSEIVFTSGATEANNLALRGVIKSYYNRLGKNASLPHIITTTIEHHCVLETCQDLEKEKLAEVSYISVDSNGIVKTEKIKNEIKKNTILISTMFVNNEIGTVQPIAEIGEIISIENEKRKNNKILFHTDAVQAMNYFSCNVDKLKVDLLSFSGHKIYGPQGVGVLYIKTGSLLKSIQTGGVQEYKKRAGTHNVPGIVGIGEAIELLKKSKNNDKILKLRDYLTEQLLTNIPQSYLNGDSKKRSPNNVNIRFDNVEGEGLLLSLDMFGIAVSTGSACSSGSLEPSHVLLALGLKHEQAHGSLRLTLGKNTTKQELDFAIKKIKETVERLRKISGNVLEEFK